MPYVRRIGTVDPVARQTWQAPDRGWLAEAAPIHLTSTNAAAATAGRLELIKVKLPAAASVTNVLMYMTTAGSGLTSGQCFGALYTEAGARVGVSADQAASWAGSTGVKTMALASGPFSCAAGNYYVGF